MKENIINQFKLLSDTDKEITIKKLSDITNGTYKNSVQSNCKHLKTKWMPRQQYYICRICGEHNI